MSLTLAALDSLHAAVMGLPRTVALPEQPATRRMVTKLGALGAQQAKPVEAVLESLRRRLLEAVTRRRLQDIDGRDLRNAAWILWQGKPLAAAMPGVLEAVIRQAEASPRVTRSLIEAWLRGFGADAPGIAEAGQAIRRLLARASDSRLLRWQQADQAFGLFDAGKGPASLAQALLHDKAPVTALLVKAGLDDAVLATGGFLRAALLEELRLTPAALFGAGAAERLARVLGLLVADGSMRFGRELFGPVGQGLLEAWRQGGKEPDGLLQSSVRGFLLQHLGDPRLRPANWTAVGEAHTAIMRRWLARASLKAFFGLIAEHALDRQWQYREAFWSACLEKGGIEDAWLALGTRVHWDALAITDLRNAFGRLGGAGGDQSVLLMRVGSLTLCEWSHNGSLRAWPSDWRHAPALGKANYSRDELTAKGLPFPPNPTYGSRGVADGEGLGHRGSENSRWQGSVAELLARRAGLHLTEADWRPR
jgi:hypothetical protein